jgi:predicted component of type VI protein secretion system
MSKELTVLVEGTQANGKQVNINIMEMSARQLLSHLKQMIKSVAQSGIVHEIEDRENPFNGVAIDHIEIFRFEDALADVEDDDDDDDDPDDDFDVFDDGDDDDRD